MYSVNQGTYKQQKFIMEPKVPKIEGLDDRQRSTSCLRESQACTLSSYKWGILS